jgi:1-deoxy-D-xylulose-5-phosphate synthase
VIVHAITHKGHGYPPAENDEIDRFHATGVIDPRTGHPIAAAGVSWTSVFAEEMLRIAEHREDVVGVTAAMLVPVGLHRFAERFPTRVFDVGIAEQHAVTSAAGMAFGGLHPVVAVYATFINRAFDQVLLDVGLHRAGVTFVLDRAGLTGDDGASHHGMWDLSLLRLVPGIRIAAPRDADTLRRELCEAVAVGDAPTVVRFPKGEVPAPIPALERLGGGEGGGGGVDILRRGGERDVLLVAVGAMVPLGLEVADRLAAQGIGVTVVDPCWVVPVADVLVKLTAGFREVVVVEDNLRDGGVASAIAERLERAQVRTPVHGYGIPRRFVEHGRRGRVLEELGLSAMEVSRQIVEIVAGLDDDHDQEPIGELPER